MGWIAALPMSALIAAEVRGVSAGDTTTRMLITAILLVVSLAALFRPAWRASTSDLAALLRDE